VGPRPTAAPAAVRQARREGLVNLSSTLKEIHMPVIAWLLGVPLIVIVLFMLVF
jgi:hypothetical protein